MSSTKAKKSIINILTRVGLRLSKEIALIHNPYFKTIKWQDIQVQNQKLLEIWREPIFGPDKDFEKRNYAPGQHGNAKRRGKQSEYAIQLMEKQKAKYTYGILERQFRNLFKKASALKELLVKSYYNYVKSRLDNVVFRLGFLNLEVVHVN